jgi:hypothetical protein
MTKTYSVSDLFFTSWGQLTPITHTEVYQLQQAICQMSVEDRGYGFAVIAILRAMRKNKWLVDKINLEQAVDIYNDLKFLNEPWYNFPAKVLPLKSDLVYAPAEKMATHTYDHFIYADNEFTSFLATNDRKYLTRLAATLYRKRGEIFLDKELVEARTQQLAKKIRPWQEDIVFLTYAQIREFITTRCKTLLPKGPAGETTKISPTGGMWLKLKHRLAETPAFQGFDSAGRANIYSALDYLEDLAQLKEKQK